jgi:excisionase family DNA binding protein
MGTTLILGCLPPLHSGPNVSLLFETVSTAASRISHAATQKHESLGPTGVQDILLSVAAVARQLGVCTATVYALCARGELPHVRIPNAIRIAPADLDAFIARKRA